MTNWAAKTSRTIPTIQDVIDPILEKYGFGDTSSREALEANFPITSAAYQAAANAIAKEQPYCAGMTLHLGLGNMERRASEAAAETLCAKGMEGSVAREMAANFFHELEAACKSLAGHYKPKGPVIAP